MDKGHILEEIRRTARANGGVPLGRLRFFNETGIRESDWVGKFWVRWNDAVREAGFEPNQLQTGYDESVLIEKYISLARELGHFPVKAELRLKKRTDASVPNEKVFARFGSKQQFATKIQQYCQDRTGYEDIVAMCAAIEDTSPVAAEDAADSGEGFGFVYLLKAGRYYKIGRTNAVGRREYELAIQLPEKASTVHTIRTDDPVGIEAYWHKRFESRHKNGEWFELSSTDVKAFKRRKFM
jgi:hypothetical protein